MEKRQIIANNNVIYYIQSPNFQKKNCFVFLHGWGQSAETFEKIFSFFDANSLPYISIDLPGFGKSPVKNLSMQVEDYADIVKALIEKLELEKPILIGHSFGGRISICLGSFYENLSRIILIGSAGIKRQENLLWLLVVKTGKAIFRVPGLHLFFEKLRNSYISQDNKNAGNLRQIFLNAIGNDLQKYMKKIHIPATLIRGENDIDTPLSEAKIIESKISNAKLFVIQKGTHFVYNEFPEEVFQIIQATT